MREGLEALLEVTGAGAEGWTVHHMGDMFVCPCGSLVELDGECPEGHVSPMRKAGMI
jgi:hypothetical protein